MALVNCPECGEKISSSAGACIHCGYRFNVCPECGEVLPNTELTCNKCGYRLVPKTDALHAENKPQQQSDYDKMSKRVQADNSFLKKMTILRVILTVISLIPAVIFSIKIVNWSNYDAEKQLLTYKDMLDSIKIFSVIFCLFSSVDFGIDCVFRKQFVTLRCANWIRQNKIEYISYLRSFYDGVTNNASEETLLRITDAAFYSENQKYKNYYIAKWVIQALITVIGCIFFGIFIVNIIDAWTISCLKVSDIGFDTGCLRRLIPAGICLALGFLFEFAFWLLTDKDKVKWQQEHNLIKNKGEK